MSEKEPGFSAATGDQYNDDTNLAARQALFNHLTSATPMAPPLSDWSEVRGLRVLDIGCGNGQFLASAGHGGATTVGMDLSIGMARTARDNAAAAVACADAHQLPCRDGSIDVLLALWMLYHVDDHGRALTEMRRVLAPEGVLVATTNSTAVSELDHLVCGSLGDLLGEPVDHWYPQLSFTAENGAEILGTVFDDVETHAFANVFEVDDRETVVAYVRSMIGPLEAVHGAVDRTALLSGIARRCDTAIAERGTVRIERAGAVFRAKV